MLFGFCLFLIKALLTGNYLYTVNVYPYVFQALYKILELDLLGHQRVHLHSGTACQPAPELSEINIDKNS
jgi:hypothetical protein